MAKSRAKNRRKGRARRPGFATRSANRSGKGMSGLERYRKTILYKRLYNALRRKGYPKKNAARISNAMRGGRRKLQR